LRLAQPSGSDAITAGSKTVVSADSGARGRTQMSLIEVLPHTPQADVVKKARRAAGVTSTPGAREMSTMLPISLSLWSRCPQVVPSQTFIAAMSSRPRTIASPTRKPAANSTSSPGVRMVMVSAVPPTRIPSGSSAASRSALAEAVTRAGPPEPSPPEPAAGTVTRTTRRRAVRPDTKTASSQVPVISAYAGTSAAATRLRPSGSRARLCPG